MHVSIETAAFSLIITFLLGFFSNLFAMAKMFVKKSEFEDFKAARIKTWADHERARSEFREYVEKMCETRRISCAPLRTTLETIQRDVNELFKLMRVNQGRLERIIGQMERNYPRSEPVEGE